MELKTRKLALRPLAAAASLGLASAAAIAPSPAAAVRPAPYEVVDLGFGGEARAINSRGQVVGEGQLAGEAHFHPFLWTGGTITDLGVLERGEREYGRATDINDHAQVVGFSVVRQDPEQSGQHAFLWQNGVLTDLDRSAYDSMANAINNHGQVAGVRYIPGGRHAVSWQNGVMTDLGPGIATGINDQGQIIGSATGTGAALWVRGRAYDLGAPAGSDDWTPVAINDRGWIVGNAWAGTDLRAYLWRAGSFVDLGTLGGSGAEAIDIDNRGQILGLSQPAGADAATHAFLWRDGTTIDLHRRGVPEYPTLDALGDRGQLVGSVGDANDHAGLYRLRR
ncbi:hypothetical protein [Actinoplanes solisilvae]|uniref:hypothetical protein n=1 Tax=Actinoplanes solisilvae TaxID=2486853 RepID=UPI000FD7C157|nr:hypothetical protein [Actinoplanes solisilvae]